MSDDRTTVEAGMELLRWQVGSEWRRGGIFVKQPDSGDGCLGSAVILAGILTGVAALVVGLIYWVDLLGPLGVFLLGEGVIIVSVGSYMVYRSRRPLQVEGRDRKRPDQVRFTSTGVIVGAHARAWHADDYCLGAVIFTPSPPMLTLNFEPAGTFVLPIPKKLVSDVEELSTLLRAKIGDVDYVAPPAAPRPKG